MSVYRVNKTRDFTVMGNTHLRDKNLSLKAVGLLSKMLSFNDGWQFSTRGLAALCIGAFLSFQEHRILCVQLADAWKLFVRVVLFLISIERLFRCAVEKCHKCVPRQRKATIAQLPL